MKQLSEPLSNITGNNRTASSLSYELAYSHTGSIRNYILYNFVRTFTCMNPYYIYMISQ